MLDPSRYSLDAATVGFRKRMGLSVDWNSFNAAIQTQTDALKTRREEEETAISEVHVMGGQRYGIGGNDKKDTDARQRRQMNGYPLRSFLATGGAVVVPPKHGHGLLATPMNMGLTQYTQYNGVVGNYVSSFTEPLNAPLDNHSILLGKAGIAARSESASDPYKALQFMLNMHQSQEAISENQLKHADIRGYNKQGLIQESVAQMESSLKSAENARKRKGGAADLISRLDAVLNTPSALRATETVESVSPSRHLSSATPSRRPSYRAPKRVVSEEQPAATNPFNVGEGEEPSEGFNLFGDPLATRLFAEEHTRIVPGASGSAVIPAVRSASESEKREARHYNELQKVVEYINNLSDEQQNIIASNAEQKMEALAYTPTYKDKLDILKVEVANVQRSGDIHQLREQYLESIQNEQTASLFSSPEGVNEIGKTSQNTAGEAFSFSAETVPDTPVSVGKKQLRKLQKTPSNMNSLTGTHNPTVFSYVEMSGITDTSTLSPQSHSSEFEKSRIGSSGSSKKGKYSAIKPTILEETILTPKGNPVKYSLPLGFVPDPLM